MFGRNKSTGNDSNEPVESGVHGDPDSGISDREQFRSAENVRMVTLLAEDYLKERKARRRWGLFFKLIIVVYIGVVLFQNQHWMNEYNDRHTGLVELSGEIGPNGMTADWINYSLRSAFEAEGSVGVILNINSPGGSPVQSAQINEEIYRLKTQYPDKPIYVTIADVCASGGYYVAVAADEIFAHPSSVVGSIGVLMDGFGFVESMKKLGIERRLLTAGTNKALLDPFSPVNPTQEAHVRQMLDDVHQQFIDTVKRGRGSRIDDDPEIYSGLFWSGEKALSLGLIDGFSTVDGVARDIIGAESVVDYTLEPTVLEQFAEDLGVSLSNVLFGNQIRFR